MMIAYKAFAPDLSCTSGGHRFQYREGIWNQEPAADCAKRGFHCAEDPLDCLTYYPNWNHSVYYLVLAGGDIHEDGVGSRLSCTKLKLVRKLDLKEFVAHTLYFLMEHPERKRNCRIKQDKGKAQDGFVIVQGKKPMAKGNLGDVLGLAREASDHPEIVEIGLFVIDGKSRLPGIWYDVQGNPLGGMNYAEEAAVNDISA